MPEINQIRVGTTTYDIRDTSVAPMTGATSSADGTGGTVPAPTTEDVEKYLCGDGTWKEPPGGGADSNIGLEAVLGDDGWMLPLGTDAVAGDYIVVDGVLGHALSAITGGSTIIVTNSNWVQETRGGLNSLKSTIDSNVVHKTGAETVNGVKTFTSTSVVQTTDGRIVDVYGEGNSSPSIGISATGLGSSGTYGNGTLRFIEYSPTSNGERTGYSEQYLLPSPDTDITYSPTYTILTTKAPITVAQGGTGATTSADARTNLGAAADADVVKIAGTQYITGDKIFKGIFRIVNHAQHPNITLVGRDSDGNPLASVNVFVEALNSATSNGNFGNPQLTFYEYPANSDGTARHTYYERYCLPAPSNSITAHKTYSILTTKSAVTIAQGGTGATTVAGARNALGLGNTSGAVPVANGGTGATTAAAALTNLGALSTTGTAAAATKLATARSLYVSLGTVYDSSNPVTFNGTAAKALPVNGTLAIAHGGTGMTDSTVSEGTTNNINYQCVKWGKVCSVHFNTASGGISKNASAGATLFTLPSGYRPYRSLYVCTRLSSTSAYEVGIIETTGAFKMFNKALSNGDSFYGEMCYVMD